MLGLAWFAHTGIHRASWMEYGSAPVHSMRLAYVRTRGMNVVHTRRGHCMRTMQIRQRTRAEWWENFQWDNLIWSDLIDDWSTVDWRLISSTNESPFTIQTYAVFSPLSSWLVTWCQLLDFTPMWSVSRTRTNTLPSRLSLPLPRDSPYCNVRCLFDSQLHVRTRTISTPYCLLVARISNHHNTIDYIDHLSRIYHSHIFILTVFSSPTPSLRMPLCPTSISGDKNGMFPSGVMVNDMRSSPFPSTAFSSQRIVPIESRTLLIHLLWLLNGWELPFQ